MTVMTPLVKKNNDNQTFIYADHQQIPFERLGTDCQQQSI
jgi:hypothetical protein